MIPRRILITGASGFVAGHLVPLLRARFPGVALSLPTAAELDVTDAAAVDAVVRDCAPDACVHLAAVTAVPAARRDPGHAWQVNLHGTLSLAEAILARAPECTLLFVSSAEIYGGSFRGGTPLDETAAPAPMNTYAATKAAADLALGAMVGDGLRVIRMRPFNHTGPGQTAEFVVPAFARQIARIASGRQDPVMQVGALEPMRDFLDVRDVCAAYVACLERADTLEPGRIFNIASGTPRRIGDILDEMLAIAGVAARVESRASLLRPSDIPMARGNADAARGALDWSPNITFEVTLRDVLDDWKGRVGGEG